MQAKHYHFIGIGGIGMSGIAQLLLLSGIKVSGSDLKESAITFELQRLGARVFLSHRAGNIEGADIAVYSSAVKEDNPEIMAAKNKNIPLLKRAQALAELMKGSVSIAITGSHGKTTTSSLASYLLMEAGLKPTAAIGGILKNIGTHVSLGEGGLFVAEADESDGSFLYYQPKYSIVTNIDYEHLDYYKSFASQLRAFREFINKTQEGGCVFACSDDHNLKEIMAGYKRKYVLFGLKEGADICPRNIEIKGLSSSFDCYDKDKFISRFNLALGGTHNISNSLSVIALGLQLGIEPEVIKRALAGYKGAGRRIEITFQNKDYLFIDDYAHHPTEIEATLAAVKNLKPKRIIAVFQPHRYTRTKLLLDQFSKSFALADYLVLTDIYPAGEPAIPGITAGLLYDRIKSNFKNKQVYYLPKEKIAGHILGAIKPQDLVITLGAGDIIKVNEELVEMLKR